MRRICGGWATIRRDSCSTRGDETTRPTWFCTSLAAIPSAGRPLKWAVIHSRGGAISRFAPWIHGCCSHGSGSKVARDSPSAAHSAEHKQASGTDGRLAPRQHGSPICIPSQMTQYRDGSEPWPQGAWTIFAASTTSLMSLVNERAESDTSRHAPGLWRGPNENVYFFFEPGETRSDSGTGPRVVRVGTHALGSTSRTTLRQRLYQHRGNAGDRGGNHRGSVFRKHVGFALLDADREITCPTWGEGNSAPRDIRAIEQPLEIRVSEVIGAMPSIEDDAGPDSMRGFVERNSIAFLSNFRRHALDAPSAGWLGRHSRSDRVRKSGLWNSNHVDERHAPDFLVRLARLTGT